MKILIVRTFPDFLDPGKYNVQEIGLAKALTRAGHEVGIVLYNGKNKDRIKSSQSRARQNNFRLDIKSMNHKRKTK